MRAIEEIPSLVRKLYTLVDRLEQLFPGRKFTLDGQVVGSLGVVLAAHLYGVKPLVDSAPVHDAEARDGPGVQVKATQRRSVGLRAEPQLLLVLQLDRDGQASEAYNGPGRAAWEAAGAMQKNGQRPITLRRLRSLIERIRPEERLPLIHSSTYGDAPNAEDRSTSLSHPGDERLSSRRLWPRS